MERHCIRCGSTIKLESHHIIQRRDGGSNNPSNLEDRCQACHDFEHAKREIEFALKRDLQLGQQNRILVFEHRLEVLEKLNTPELIKERGFVSYWTDPTTHILPRIIHKREENKLQTKLF